MALSKSILSARSMQHPCMIYWRQGLEACLQGESSINGRPIIAVERKACKNWFYMCMRWGLRGAATYVYKHTYSSWRCVCVCILTIASERRDSTLRIAVGLCLGTTICAPHICHSCGAEVSACGTHGISCKSSVGRHSHHAAINDNIHCTLTTGLSRSTANPRITSHTTVREICGYANPQEPIRWPTLHSTQLLSPMHVLPSGKGDLSGSRTTAAFGEVGIW